MLHLFDESSIVLTPLSNKLGNCHLSTLDRAGLHDRLGMCTMLGLDTLRGFWPHVES